MAVDTNVEKLILNVMTKAQYDALTPEQKQALELFFTTDEPVVEVSDIIDNLTSSSTDKPLSAKQGKALKDLIDAEITSRTNADTNLGTRITNEATNRTNADDSLGVRITNETNARTNAINVVQASIDDISALIPGAASSDNQLGDKAFINSSIASATSNFLGTLDATTDLGLTKPASHANVISALNNHVFSSRTNNDYCFVVNTDNNNNAIYERFKWVASSNTFAYEYTLNNSSFTAAQWNAINSGITSSKVSEITANTNARHSHGNKALLDTYNQTNENLTDAVGKKHEHSNKALLDTYTQTEANLADAVSKKHSHSNKAILDDTTASFTAEQANTIVEHTTKLNNAPIVIDAEGLCAEYYSSYDSKTLSKSYSISNDKVVLIDNLYYLPYWDSSIVDYTTTTAQSYIYKKGSNYYERIRIFNYRNYTITISGESGFAGSFSLTGTTVSPNSEYTKTIILGTSRETWNYSGTISYTFDSGTQSGSCTVVQNGYNRDYKMQVSPVEINKLSDYYVFYAGLSDVDSYIQLSYNPATNVLSCKLFDRANENKTRIDMSKFTFELRTKSSTSNLGKRIATQLNGADKTKPIELYDFRLIDTSRDSNNLCVLSSSSTLGSNVYEGYVVENDDTYVIHIEANHNTAPYLTYYLRPINDVIVSENNKLSKLYFDIPDSLVSTVNHGWEYSTDSTLIGNYSEGLVPDTHGLVGTYAYARLWFYIKQDGSSIIFSYYQNCLNHNHYCCFSNIDTELATGWGDVTTNVKTTSQDLSGAHTVTYSNVSKGMHYITIKFRKNNNAITNPDIFTIYQITATDNCMVIRPNPQYKDKIISALPIADTVIKQIGTQYTRITDLDTGIYELTYPGIKYLYYYGKTNTSNTFTVPSNDLKALMIVNKSASYAWQTYLFCYSNSTSPVVHAIATGTSTGNVKSINLTDIMLPYTKCSPYTKYGVTAGGDFVIWGVSYNSLNNVNLLKNSGLIVGVFNNVGSTSYGLPYVPSGSDNFYLTTMTLFEYNAPVRQDFYALGSKRHFRRYITNPKYTPVYGAWQEIHENLTPPEPTRVYPITNFIWSAIEENGYYKYSDYVYGGEEYFIDIDLNSVNDVTVHVQGTFCESEETGDPAHLNIYLSNYTGYKVEMLTVENDVLSISNDDSVRLLYKEVSSNFNLIFKMRGNKIEIIKYTEVL